MRAARGRLHRGLAELNLDSEPSTADQLLRFCGLLLEANRATNLTGAKTLEAAVEHVIDSLAPLQFVPMAEPVVDVGSGAGFPGVPAAIVFNRKKFFLIEPRRKRAAFLESAANALGLENVRVLQGSASGPAVAEIAGNAGTVLMRAVAPPIEAIQIGLPLLRPKGALLVYQGRAAVPAMQEREAARRLHARIEVKPVDVPGLDGTRHAWIITRRPRPKRAT